MLILERKKKKACKLKTHNSYQLSFNYVHIKANGGSFMPWHIIYEIYPRALHKKLFENSDLNYIIYPLPSSFLALA